MEQYYKAAKNDIKDGVASQAEHLGIHNEKFHEPKSVSASTVFSEQHGTYNNVNANFWPATCESHKHILNALLPFVRNAAPDEISRKKRRYHFNKNGQQVVYFLQDGDYFLSTQGGQKVINLFSAPYVVGLLPHKEEMPLYLERVDHGKIGYIAYETFWKLVFELKLFDEAMLIMSAQQSELINYIALNKQNALEEVRSLIHWWSRIPEHLKRRFSVMYLLEKSCWLSKSSISRSIKAMRDQGELLLERGRIT